MDYTLLVNKDNALDEKYIPDSLVEYPEYNGVKIDPNYKTLVDAVVLNSFYEMQSAALIEGKLLGYPCGFGLVIDSGYRSYDYQMQILKKNIEKSGDEAYSYVALPGTSEHQTGLAIDIALNTGGKYNDEFDDSFPEIQWVHNNCYRFGFILRYPQGYEHITGFKYESWHLRFVGKEIAKYMHENGIKTLEDYHLAVRKK